MKTTCRCGATWTGLRIEHCCACHQTFAGTDPADRHRTGRHHLHTCADRRRCLTPEELIARGMTYATNTHGTRIWSRGTAGRRAAPRSLVGQFAAATRRSGPGEVTRGGTAAAS